MPCAGTYLYKSRVKDLQKYSTWCYSFANEEKEVIAIHKTKWFDCWVRKQGLNESNLCTAVSEMADGLYDAGGLLKKRFARSGQGKRGGFRTLVATNKENRWVFICGFPKHERSNLEYRQGNA